MSNYETKNIFAKNLSALLAENNETQAALAEILHVAASSVSGWCCGAKMPRMDKIEQIAFHFGVPRSRLIEENQFPSSNARHIDKELETENFSTPEIKMIKKYRALDEHGKRIVDFVLDEESERMNAEDSEYMCAAARDGGLVKIPKPDEEAELPEKDSFIDGL